MRFWTPLRTLFRLSLHPANALSPSTQSLRGLAHVRFRTTIAEPYEPVAPGAVEIDAGTDRDARLLQHPGAERRAVVRPIRDICKQIEGPLTGGQSVESGRRQRRQQMIPRAPIASNIRLQLLPAFECRLCRDL